MRQLAPLDDIPEDEKSEDEEGESEELEEDEPVEAQEEPSTETVESLVGIEPTPSEKLEMESTEVES